MATPMLNEMVAQIIVTTLFLKTCGLPNARFAWCASSGDNVIYS